MGHSHFSSDRIRVAQEAIACVYIYISEETKTCPIISRRAAGRDTTVLICNMNDVYLLQRHL